VPQQSERLFDHFVGAVLDHEEQFSALQRRSGAVINLAGCDLDVASSKWRDLDDAPRSLRREATMNPIGAVFQPELIEVMKAVLDDATAMLPEAKRTSTMKAEIASHILECAAKGERDPTALKMAALLAVVECTHYSHDISPARKVV
jgi:hypothetical protein